MVNTFCLSIHALFKPKFFKDHVSHWTLNMEGQSGPQIDIVINIKIVKDFSMFVKGSNSLNFHRYTIYETRRKRVKRLHSGTTSDKLILEFY